MIPPALAIALGVRSLSLLLPHTYFQPDEFYQAFEPAYAHVFGTGYLTWEWRDLPSAGGGNSWWETVVVGGRLRGWIWPGVFVGVYELVRALGLEKTNAIVLAPRVVGVVVAALTDYYTYLLAGKVLSRRSAAAALFLSLTSLFNAHLLPRALSTSPETLLTVAAVYYYPLQLHIPARRLVKKKANGNGNAANGDAKVAREYNYSRMDRAEDKPDLTANLVLAAALAALSVCIRPTMLVFWGYMSLEAAVVAWSRAGVSGVLALFAKTAIGGTAVLLLSTLIDYHMVGRLTLPLLSFFHRNVVMNIASFYGATGLTYHLVQSLPILLFPVWYWWGQGYLASLLPARWLPPSLAVLDRPAPLRTLARSIAFTIAVLSLSPHSEWRFVHPLLPLLLLFAIPALQRRHRPPFMGCPDVMSAFRGYFRLTRNTFLLLTLAPVLPFMYLNVWHGGAQVSVMNDLRTGKFGPVDSVAVLMPCHSTPWASHLGDVASTSWFLTCEPPLAGERWTQQEAFYDRPVSYIQDVFPSPPSRDSDSTSASGETHPYPSHVVLFGCVLDTLQDGTTFRDALAKQGYAEVANLWNGFDVAQDDERRAGGVRVWRREDAQV